jgi:hypothetical protein
LGLPRYDSVSLGECFLPFRRHYIPAEVGRPSFFIDFLTLEGEGNKEPSKRQGTTHPTTQHHIPRKPES